MTPTPFFPFDSQKIINGAWLAVLVSLIWILSACGRGNPSPYRIIDSGIQANSNIYSAVWLDENRLLVSGYEPSIVLPGASLTFPAQKALGIWDLKSQSVKKYRSIDADIRCYSPVTRKITYISKGGIDAGREVVAWNGVLSQEKKIEFSDLRLGLSRFDICDVDEDEEVKKHLPGNLNGRDDVLKLPEGRGFIWPFGRDPAKHDGALFDTWSYFDSLGNELARFPLSSNYLTPCCQWLDWGKGYFISKENPPNAISHIGWTLYTSGQLKEIRIPPRTKISTKHPGSSVYSFLLTKSGVVFHYKTLDDRNGIYLAKGDQLFKVANDVAIWAELKVSPDGCKVVYVADDKSVTIHAVKEHDGSIVGYTDPQQYSGPGKSTGRIFQAILGRFKVIDVCGPVVPASNS